MKRIISIITALIMTLSIVSCTGNMQNDDGNSVLELDASVEETSEEVNEYESEFESSETEESEDFASSENNSKEEISSVQSELTSSNEDVVMQKTSRNRSHNSSRNSKIEKEKVFHTVTFKNGNIVLKTQKVQHGESAVAPEEPKKEGTFFTSWDKKFDNVKNDITVKAEWLSKEQMNRFGKGYEGKQLIKTMNKAKSNDLIEVWLWLQPIDTDKIIRQEIGNQPKNSTIGELDEYIAKRREIIFREYEKYADDFIKKYINKNRKILLKGISPSIILEITKSEIIALAQINKVYDISLHINYELINNVDDTDDEP